MAHPYTTRARVRATILAPGKLADLLDGNDDGVEDRLVNDAAAVVENIDSVIAEMCVITDARLASRYASSLPLPAITDVPPTDPLATNVTNYMVLARLYALVDPSGEQAKYWGDLADSVFNGIASKALSLAIPEDTATSSRGSVRWSGSGPIVSGVDAYGNPRGRSVTG